MADDTVEKDFSGPNGVTDHHEEPKPATDGQVGSKPETDSELREFLMQRHGRVDLNPLPSTSLNDPLNWGWGKKHAWLFLIAFHAMFALFMFAGLIPGYKSFAMDYHRSLTAASYLTAVQILFAGVSPLIWSPLSAHYGRRPILLISTLGSCVCNIGGARAYSYGAQITTRILVAIFISPPLAIGSGIVAETFFAHERASKMGVWTLMLTMATSVGPLLTGFIFQRHPVYWVLWFFAIVNFCQFLAYFFLNAESRYIRPSDKRADAHEAKQRLWTVRRISPDRLTFSDFTRPFIAGRYLSVLVPACAYAIVFGYAGVAITVEMPQVMGEKFKLDAQATGLQFISIIIGNVLGEQFSTWTSDPWVRYWNKRRYDRAVRAAGENNTNGNGDAIVRTQTIGGTTNIDPTPRLWLAYVGFLTSIVGLIIWGVESQVAPAGTWTVKPLVGAAIASFGLQAVTTSLYTFAVDCHRPLSAEIGVLVNLIRQVWGFIGPFYFPPMFKTLGFGGSGGVMAGITGAFWIMVVMLHYWERRKFLKRGFVQH